MGHFNAVDIATPTCYDAHSLESLVAAGSMGRVPTAKRRGMVRTAASDAMAQDVAALTSELARHGKGLNSPEAIRLRELLHEADRLASIEQDRNARGSLDINTVEYFIAIEAIQGQILHEFKPYFESMQKRYDDGRTVAVWIGRGMYIAGWGVFIWAFLTLLNLLKTRWVQGILGRLDNVVGSSLSDVAGFVIVVLVPIACIGYILAVGGDRLYQSIHRGFTGRNPPRASS